MNFDYLKKRRNIWQQSLPQCFNDTIKLGQFACHIFQASKKGFSTHIELGRFVILLNIFQTLSIYIFQATKKGYSTCFVKYSI